MSKGYVYILTNPSMPGLVKIGKTTRSPEGRANELYQTGVPTPFKVEAKIYSPDCDDLETTLHEQYSERRVSAAREFFRADPVEVERVAEQYLFEQVSCLVSDYLISHVLCNELAHVSEADVFWLSELVNRPTHEVAGAIEMLTPDELAPALERYDAKMSGRCALKKPQNTELKVVGES